MKVIATAIGFAGSLRQPGDTFEMPEGAKASWFTEVKQDAKDTKGKKADDKKADESLT